MPYRILACGHSDPGLIRQNNEDFWGEVSELQLYVLADGMGGHKAGEVAAYEAVISLCRLLKKALGRKRKMSLYETRDAIRHAIEQVNGIIYKLSRTDEQYRGMGTTLCCVHFHDRGVVYAHVGDSRIYRLNQQKLELLTSDHSLLRELLELGQLNEYEAPDFLYKNIITKAIGTAPLVEPTIQVCDVVPGDIYLMCSDGLSDLLKEEEIEEILRQAPNLSYAAQKLVSEANMKGGFDNITAVIMQVQEFHEA